MFEDQEMASENEYEIQSEVDNFTMDDLYRREAYTTTILLQETQDLLYSNEGVNINCEEESELTRPPTFGYEAHVEKVNTKEAMRWKNCFKYMCVSGISISNPNLKLNSDSNLHLTSFSTDALRTDDASVHNSSGNMDVMNSNEVIKNTDSDSIVDEYICSDGYFSAHSSQEIDE